MSKDKEKKNQKNKNVKKNTTPKRHLKPWVIIVILVVVILGAAAGGFFYYENSLVWKTCYVEAGVSISPADFMKDPSIPASFSEGFTIPDTTIPGEYVIEIDACYLIHKSNLIVQDTIAPIAEAEAISITVGEECDPMQFITYLEDATQVTASYEVAPDYDIYGEQNVRIKLTDMGGNETIVDSTLFISQVQADVYMEAGASKPTLADFVVGGGDSKFITNLSAINYNKPQDAKVLVSVDGIEYESVLHIRDTVAPTATFKNIESFTGILKTAEDFVVEAEDNTKIKYSFETEPDFNMVGTQNLIVNVTDLGGNVTSGEVTLTLADDTEFPVISGVTEITVFVNSTISYMKGVTITDNCSEGLKTSIDHTQVNSTVAGDYPITYTATDASGNTTTVDSVIHVRERVYDINEINAAADRALAGIITDGMSNYDKCYAIFNYVKHHVTYLNGSDKNNYLRGAYEGLIEGRGDCFVYAATSKILLTRAGIPNMDIAKIPSSTHHYWNLVDIGDGHGWYHFDTTPRKDHPVIFLWDEATMMAYSAQHYGSHNYDHNVYPVVP